FDVENGCAICSGGYTVVQNDYVACLDAGFGRDGGHEFDPECASFTNHTLCANASAHCFCKSLRKRKTKARAFHIAMLRPESFEWREEPVHSVERNALTGILHKNTDLVLRVL